MKILPPYFEAVASGRKAFEVRRDDRGFAEGDTLRLREWEPPMQWPSTWNAYTYESYYTGREISVHVTYLLRDLDGLQDGYVVLGIELANPAAREAVMRAASREAGLRVLTEREAALCVGLIDGLMDPDAGKPVYVAPRVLAAIDALRGEEVQHG